LFQVLLGLELKNCKHEENKLSEKVKKKTMPELFKKGMALPVHSCKLGRSGTSNDGNTVRRFLNIVKNLLELLMSAKNLILRFCVVLQNISRKFELNVKEFN
jgi:hypothetical protein